MDATRGLVKNITEHHLTGSHSAEVLSKRLVELQCTRFLSVTKRGKFICLSLMFQAPHLQMNSVCCMGGACLKLAATHTHRHTLTHTYTHWHKYTHWYTHTHRYNWHTHRLTLTHMLIHTQHDKSIIKHNTRTHTMPTHTTHTLCLYTHIHTWHTPCTHTNHTHKERRLPFEDSGGRSRPPWQYTVRWSQTAVCNTPPNLWVSMQGTPH